MEIKEEIKDWENNTGLTFLKKVGIKLNDSVLDFGCKYGIYTIPVAKIVGKNGFVYALDKHAERLNELIKKAKAKDLENIKRIYTNGKLKIPLGDENVDVVLLYDVIHLVGKNDSSKVNDRMKLYKEVYRIAKDNALISVYPTHLTTHTDISLVKEVKKELIQYFQFEKEFSSKLIHDDKLVDGKILNFRKVR